MPRKTFIGTMISLWLVLLTCSIVHAQQKLATPKEAEANVKKAVSYYKFVGKEKAFAEFNKTDGRFTNLKKGLYISIYDLQGKNWASGAIPAFAGKNFIDLKDPDGVYIIRSLIDIAKKKGEGWLNYKWSNPSTKKTERKVTYMEKVDGYMFCCGAYLK